MKYLIGIGCGFFNYLLHLAWVQKEQDDRKESVIKAMFPNTWPRVIALLLYPAAETLAAAAFTAYGYGPLKIVRYCVLMGALIPIAYKDYKEKTIPNRYLAVLAGIRVFLLIAESAAYPFAILENVKFTLIGALMGGGILFFTYIVTRHGIGLGDVKLFAVIGMYIGSQRTYIAILASLLIAAAYGVVKVIGKRLRVKDEIAFAPFTAIGTLIILGLGF
ncbi:MAG: prepilin peptidase [Lachnospiraceae bacterium]|nr:prepilin peptidase [Lachnospiraceae bacterium]